MPVFSTRNSVRPALIERTVAPTSNVTVPIFGEGISIALGYGVVAAQEIAESFRRNEFSFRGYKRRLARSALGQTLFARWLITYIIYPMKWKWFQILTWWICKPIVLFVAWVFVLNWSKRLK